MTQKPPPKDHPVHISGIVRDVCRSCRHEADAEMTQVWEHWNTAVGETIARNAQPAAFRGSTLVVVVSSSVWRQELRYLKATIIENVNTALGQALVKEIKFKVGSL
jgi:predicted nucleic acid-binding Zn ribbon protein